MMKALLLILGLAALPLGARTFTSADGTKKIEADLIAVRPSTDTIVITYKGRNTRVTTKASAFSKEDQAYFKKFHKEATKRHSLRVTTEAEAERFKTGEDRMYQYDNEKRSFRVSVFNKSDFDFEDLTAKYDIYLNKYVEGKKTIEVVSGEESIDEILSHIDAQFVTQSVDLIIDCSTKESCPKCQTQAASVKRERVIGLRVKVFNDKDEMLTEYYSSNNAKSTAEKMDKES
jgi:hypothetical protein